MSYSFLDFGLTKLNIFSSMVLTYTSAQREYSHNTDYARAVKRCLSSVSVGLAKKVSYRRMAWGSTSCGENAAKMTRNTKNTWKTSSHIMGTPVGYLKFLA
ncbi:ALS_1a_G0016750.mRNA.1.CDS.1 [Saccharomyces cerevisiae]|nr:ALS_1a_G0016750.mRNA.1.CDS.1 [Saccharomyces cerevisiae]CAI6641329.1 ALS_1a_G0016750.mRNA.1.CDS.1 [Saccharomyces cerevisiae]